MPDLFDFSAPGASAGWASVDDAVMGGRSASQMRDDPGGHAKFTGTVSLDNGGGFASVRSPLFAPKGGVIRQFELRVRGDGRLYKLNLRMDRSFDSVNYQVTWSSAAGAWTTLCFSIVQFQPTLRGRIVPAPALDTAQVCQVGLMTGDRQPGPFCLAVQWIRAT